MTISRRTLAIALAGIVAVAAVVVGVVVATSGGSTDSGGAATTSSGPASRPAFLVGVPQQGITLGDPSAPALYEYADPQCPYCADAASQLIPGIVEQYVKTGKVKLVWHGLAFIGPESLTALKAIDAAAQQNRLWDVAERVYAHQGAENQGWVTEQLLTDVGAGIRGLDVEQWKSDWDAKPTNALITEANAAAVDAGVQGTPTFVFDGQQLQLTAFDLDAFRQAIDPLLG